MDTAFEKLLAEIPRACRDAYGNRLASASRLPDQRRGLGGLSDEIEAFNPA